MPRPRHRAAAPAALAACVAAPAACGGQLTPRMDQSRQLEAAPAPPADHHVAHGADASLRYGALRLPGGAGAGPFPAAEVARAAPWLARGGAR